LNELHRLHFEPSQQTKRQTSLRRRKLRRSSETPSELLLILIGFFWRAGAHTRFFLPIPLLRDSSSGRDDSRNDQKTDEYEHRVATW
jgi:hypothetical protein